MHLLYVYVYSMWHIVCTDLHVHIRAPSPSTYVVVRENDDAREMQVLIAPQAELLLRHAVRGVPGVSRRVETTRSSESQHCVKATVNVDLGVALGEHEWAIV